MTCYRILIRKQRFKCANCCEFFTITEEILYSRGEIDDKDPRAAGLISMINLDYKCTNFSQRMHGDKNYYIPSTDTVTPFESRLKYKRGGKDGKGFPNKQTWLQHLKSCFPNGICVTFRAGKIGREELMGEGLNGLSCEKMVINDRFIIREHGEGDSDVILGDYLFRSSILQWGCFDGRLMDPEDWQEIVRHTPL